MCKLTVTASVRHSVEGVYISCVCGMSIGPVLHQQFSRDCRDESKSTLCCHTLTLQEYEGQSDNMPPWLTSIWHIPPDPSPLVLEEIDLRKRDRVLLLNPPLGDNFLLTNSVTLPVVISPSQMVSQP